MSTHSAAISDQAGVDAAASYDAAASSILDMEIPGVDSGGSAPEKSAPESTKAAVAEDAGAASTGKADANADASAAAAAAKQASDAAVTAGQTDAQKWAVDQVLLEKALADPTHGSIVKQLNDRLQESEKFREYFKTPEEAQAALALAPGGIEELKTHVERGKAAVAEQAQFASGNPEQQRTALDSIAKEMPEQFVAGMPVYMELAARINPEKYSATIRTELKRSLEADGVGALLQTVRSLMAKGENATSDDEKAFGTAMGQLMEWSDKAGLETAKTGMAPAGKTAKEDSPEMKEMREKLAKYETSEHQETARTWKTWEEPTNSAIHAGIEKDLTEKLEKYFPPNTEKGFKEFTMKARVAQITAELQKQLAADPDLQKKLNDVIFKENAWRKNGEAVRTQVVNLQTGRAKQILPHVVAELMKGAATYEVNKAAEKTNRETARAATADITGHAGGHAAKSSWGVKDVKRGGALAGKSEEEILEM